MADLEYASSPLMTCLRLFLSIFTILSFALATAPGLKKPVTNTDVEGRVPLDMTVNVTVLGGLHWSEGRTNLVLDKNWKERKNNTDVDAPVSVLAVPALFGPVIKTAFKAPLLLLDLDACDPFTISLPEVAELDMLSSSDSSKSRVDDANSTSAQDKKNVTKQSSTQTLHRRGGAGVFNETSSSNTAFVMQPEARKTKWFVLIPRGNCPFDVKVYHAQQAGFSGAIIYSNHTPAANGTDLPVRMSSNALGDRISLTSAMFVTNQDARKIIDSSARNDFGSQHIPGPLWITLSPDSWPTAGWGGGVNNGVSGDLTRSLIGLVADLVFLTITVFVLSIAFMSLYLVINMIRNYMVHGSMFVVIMHYAHTPSDMDFGEREEEEEEQKLLEKITLPLRVVKEEDLSAGSGDEAGNDENESGMAAGGTRECCAICIDEFLVGSRPIVRFRQESFSDKPLTMMGAPHTPSRAAMAAAAAAATDDDNDPHSMVASIAAHMDPAQELVKLGEIKKTMQAIRTARQTRTTEAIEILREMSQRIETKKEEIRQFNREQAAKEHASTMAILDSKRVKLDLYSMLGVVPIKDEKTGEYYKFLIPRSDASEVEIVNVKDSNYSRYYYTNVIWERMN
ncbi:hypothetical protein HDU96_001815 [Phlyctochytrium bullatum]|nr:hypothetical protein HDU96_001815 [Phlyctochytrium bullatum]